MNDGDLLNTVCFIATLTAIVLLSKIGGTGADLAIMTGLIGVLGMLVGRRERQQRNGQPQDVNVVNPPADPVPVEEPRT